jgi:hypothetical protein
MFRLRRPADAAGTSNSVPSIVPVLMTCRRVTMICPTLKVDDLASTLKILNQLSTTAGDP